MVSTGSVEQTSYTAVCLCALGANQIKNRHPVPGLVMSNVYVSAGRHLHQPHRRILYEKGTIISNLVQLRNRINECNSTMSRTVIILSLYCVQVCAPCWNAEGFQFAVTIVRPIMGQSSLQLRSDVVLDPLHCSHQPALLFCVSPVSHGSTFLFCTLQLCPSASAGRAESEGVDISMATGSSCITSDLF